MIRWLRKLKYKDVLIEAQRGYIRELSTSLHEANKTIDTLNREFDIVDGACDFWKNTAEELGYDDCED